MPLKPAVLLLGLTSSLGCVALSEAWPGERWEQREPEGLGLKRDRLEELAELVGGRGCVIRHGFMAYTWGDQSKSADVASALKPVLSTLLLLAVQEGKLASVDDAVVSFEPRLAALGKDAGITWRHLASQTSGYGLSEKPGEAYSYNDYAIALYYDTLINKVFREPADTILRARLAEPLQFEDAATFEAFGPKDRPGRLALSVRDFARIGLMFLRDGKWRERQILQPTLCQLMLNNPVPSDLPVTVGREAPMIPGQRTIGGTRNITPVGPGYYSFNWWLNRTNHLGQRLFEDAPADTFVASGHGGKHMVWIIPSLDIVVSWNDSAMEDHDHSLGNRESKCNQAARLLVAAVQPPRTEIAVDETHFTINGESRFLLGITYYGGLAASRDNVNRDLDDMQRHGFNWLRVWAMWASFSNNVAAVDGAGRPREPLFSRLKQLIAACDERGMVVDVTLSRGIGPAELRSMEAHRRAVETLATELKEFRNWYLDLSNERSVRDKRFTSVDDLKELRMFARSVDPSRLVTASHGTDITRDELRDYLEIAKVDFICPHRPRNREAPMQTASQTKQYLSWMRELGHAVPVHYQEPFRRGYGDWNPTAEDFMTDLKESKKGGAAGWCFHNGAERGKTSGEPRRSFDLGQKRLFDQFDEQEREFLDALKNEPP